MTDVLERKRWVVVCPCCQCTWRFAHEADAVRFADTTVHCGWEALDVFRDPA